MNVVDTGFAFLEGLALIASPCILPVLPLILATSIDGGKGRPYGIIVGFSLFFGLFAYTAKSLIGSAGIDLDLVRNVSVAFLCAFALILLIPALSRRFDALTAPLASAGSRLTQGKHRGFVGGVLIGAPIGLIWTPCAGPILAAVLVQVSLQQSNADSLLVLIGFALGAGIPMMAIALFGRKALEKARGIQRHGRAIRRGSGILILLSVGFILTGIDPQQFFSEEKRPSSRHWEGLVNAIPFYPAPEINSIERWFNSRPLTIKSLRGKVVLIDFWTYSCINCVRSIPTLIEWDKKYKADGLQIIGVHSREFQFEKYPGNVEKAIREYGIPYPVALDTWLRTWLAFENRFWPAQYLINQDGQIVYTKFGEGDEDITENNIRTLLALKKRVGPEDGPKPYSREQTPETYLGYLRGGRYGGKEKITRDHTVNYAFPPFLQNNKWALEGTWKITGERAVTREGGAKLRLNFNARKVFLVLGTLESRPVKLHMTLNGEPIGDASGADAPGGVVTVNHHDLYELVDQKEMKNGLLEITADQAGLEVFAFTFGS